LGQATAVDFPVVSNGPAGSVRLAPDVFAEYGKVCEGRDEISTKRKRHFERYFERFCATHQHGLGPEKFDKQGDFPDGRGSSVAIFAFKSWQCRIYGAILHLGNRKCFIGAAIDTSKKQDKANQRILREAAVAIGRLIEHQQRIDRR